MKAMYRVFTAFALVGSATGMVDAQPKRPQATLTPAVVTREIVPGRECELALKVVLPAKVHVQSNKPSDPLFIPTVLTIEAPPGVTLREIVYPPSERLKQAGLAEPLTVFGTEFTLRIRVQLGPDISAGDLHVPGRLRYQACDETTCYPTARADATWTLRVTKG